MPAVIQVWGNLIPLHSLIKCFTLHIKNLDHCIWKVPLYNAMILGKIIIKKITQHSGLAEKGRTSFSKSLLVHYQYSLNLMFALKLAALTSPNSKPCLLTPVWLLGPPCLPPRVKSHPLSSHCQRLQTITSCCPLGKKTFHIFCMVF